MASTSCDGEDYRTVRYDVTTLADPVQKFVVSSAPVADGPALDPSITPDASAHETAEMVARCPYCSPKPKREVSQQRTESAGAEYARVMSQRRSSVVSMSYSTGRASEEAAFRRSVTHSRGPR